MEKEKNSWQKPTIMDFVVNGISCFSLGFSLATLIAKLLFK